MSIVLVHILVGVLHTLTDLSLPAVLKLKVFGIDPASMTVRVNGRCILPTLSITVPQCTECLVATSWGQGSSISLSSRKDR